MGGENSSEKNPIYHSAPGFFLLNLFCARNASASPEFGARWGQHVAVPITSWLRSLRHARGQAVLSRGQPQAPQHRLPPPYLATQGSYAYVSYLFAWVSSHSKVSFALRCSSRAYQATRRDSCYYYPALTKDNWCGMGCRTEAAPGFQELQLWNRDREENASRCQE